MRLTNSLRFRVALLFAIFGALLSSILCAGIYLAAHKMADHLVDEILNAELEGSSIRHTFSPTFIPPNTQSIKGFVLSNEDSDLNIPQEVKSLPHGIHEVTIGGLDYRVLVADRNEHHYFILFDINDQNKREQKLAEFLILFALFMTLCSTGGGFCLATRIISPLTRLALHVEHAEPGDVQLPLDKLARKDEVGELARALDRYIHQIINLLENEKHFTSDVSHELRTPLSVILGVVEIMEQDETLSPKQKERIARIHRSANGLSELSTALLFLVRNFSPTADLKPIDLAEVVRTNVAKHQSLVNDRPVSLETEIIATPLLKVELPLLDTVISNLLRNALFNTNSGTITLRVENNRLIIKDTGFGIPQSMLANIFERHYKGATSSGSGIGLSIVKRICDRYGWHISINSQEGSGTTVEIIFTQDNPISSHSTESLSDSLRMH